MTDCLFQPNACCAYSLSILCATLCSFNLGFGLKYNLLSTCLLSNVVLVWVTSYKSKLLTPGTVYLRYLLSVSSVC